jgi:CDP-diacylglycerol--serine O-phosphatidyltransferase
MDEPARKPPARGVYILPNMLTTASLFSGFLGVLWAISGQYEYTSVAILVSCVFDGLDGKVARLTGTSSDFGVQFDSLADLVAFGVTPAIMVYQWELSQFKNLGIMASFLLVACGALRLARFNVLTKITNKKFFLGLPIPAQACTVATFYLFTECMPSDWQSLTPKVCLGLVYVLSFLMVSRVRYASFKEFGLIKAHPFSMMVTAILLFVLVASQPKILGFVVFVGYILSGVFYTYFILPRRTSLREPSEELSS